MSRSTFRGLDQRPFGPKNPRLSVKSPFSLSCVSLIATLHRHTRAHYRPKLGKLQPQLHSQRYRRMLNSNLTSNAQVKAFKLLQCVQRPVERASPMPHWQNGEWKKMEMPTIRRTTCQKSNLKLQTLRTDTTSSATNCPLTRKNSQWETLSAHSTLWLKRMSSQSRKFTVSIPIHGAITLEIGATFATKTRLACDPTQSKYWECTLRRSCTGVSYHSYGLIPSGTVS